MKKYFSSLIWLAVGLMSTSTQAHQDPEIAGYIEVDGGRIWYRLNGAEHIGKTPAIIVAHGGPGGTHRGNMPYVSLSDKYPVILYDQLGTGRSDRPNNKKNWKVEHFVAEIDYIREALKLDEVIIAGHSWGAQQYMAGGKAQSELRNDIERSGQTRTPNAFETDG